MKLFHWTPDLVIAAIVIIGCMILRFRGINSEVWAVMLLATGWVFGGQWQNRQLVRRKVEVIEHDERP